MREALQTVQVEHQDPVVQRWQQQNPNADTTNVPFFTLKVSMRRMRDDMLVLMYITSSVQKKMQNC